MSSLQLFHIVYDVDLQLKLEHYNHKKGALLDLLTGFSKPVCYELLLLGMDQKWGKHEMKRVVVVHWLYHTSVTWGRSGN